MLPILCFVVAQAQANYAQEPPSLYQAVVSKPNPSNGYEDFLLAMDALKTNNFRTLYANISGDQTKPILVGRKQLTDRFAYALSEVRVGLRKRIYNPQEIVEPTTSFPETAWMIDMTRLLICEANVRHATGNVLASTQSFIDAYEFNSAIQRSGPTEPYTAGIEPKNKVLIELVNNLPKYALPELAQIEKWAQSKLNNTDLLDSLGFENVNIQGQLDNVVSGKWRGRTDRENALLQQLGSLSFSDRNLARGQVEKDVKSALGLWTNMLKQPERYWAQPEFPQYSRYGTGFVQDINTKIYVAARGLAVERAKLRMLVVECRLYTYRWNYERFPGKLTDAVDLEAATDPSSGQLFTYEPSAAGVRLSTNGSRMSGPVYLVEGKIEPAKN